MRYVRNPQARTKRVGRKVAVYLPATGAVHVLNSTAELLFELLAEPASLDELTTLFGELTDGDAETIERDLAGTLETFEELQVCVSV